MPIEEGKHVSEQPKIKKPPIPLKLCLLGNVNSGKSSLI